MFRTLANGPVIFGNGCFGSYTKSPAWIHGTGPAQSNHAERVRRPVGDLVEVKREPRGGRN